MNGFRVDLSICIVRMFSPRLWPTNRYIGSDLSCEAVEGVDCYKCTSRNGSNPACEDPFHNLNSTRMTGPITPDPPPNVIYQTPCWAGKKNKEGLFLASACIKLTGTFGECDLDLLFRHHHARVQVRGLIFINSAIYHRRRYR